MKKETERKVVTICLLIIFFLSGFLSAWLLKPEKDRTTITVWRCRDGNNELWFCYDSPLTEADWFYNFTNSVWDVMEGKVTIEGRQDRLDSGNFTCEVWFYYLIEYPEK
jgi:hypothetical protein